MHVSLFRIFLGRNLLSNGHSQTFPIFWIPSPLDSKLEIWIPGPGRVRRTHETDWKRPRYRSIMAFIRLVRSFSSVKMRSTPHPSLGISTTVQWTRFLQIVSIDGLTSTSTHLPSIFLISISGSRSYLTMETVSYAMGDSNREPRVNLFDRIHRHRKLKLSNSSSSVVSEIALAMSSSSHGFKVIETSHFTDFTS